ncbi:MAG: hypothetical protein ABJN95_16120 [Maribacter sp.]|uniref:hypothetical protein n=1 Tax=Maribacter sp. TaxID=1897614 RepID=UPI003299E2B3
MVSNSTETLAFCKLGAVKESTFTIEKQGSRDFDWNYKGNAIATQLNVKLKTR